MSAYQNSEKFETSYVFKDVDEELARYLYSFWKDYHHEFWNNFQKLRGKEVNPNQIKQKRENRNTYVQCVTTSCTMYTLKCGRHFDHTFHCRDIHTRKHVQIFVQHLVTYTFQRFCKCGLRSQHCDASFSVCL